MSQDEIKDQIIKVCKELKAEIPSKLKDDIKNKQDSSGVVRFDTKIESLKKYVEIYTTLEEIESKLGDEEGPVTGVY